MSGNRRGRIVTFRVSPREERELKLLARAEGTSRSALIRRLVRERVDDVVDRDGEGGGSGR